jgi:hypothetical protein
MSRVNPPDFEIMQELSEDIFQLQEKKTLLELDIEEKEAETVFKVRNDEEYFINGKPPAMNYVKDSYMVTGINGELMELRRELAQIESRLDLKERQFWIYRNMIDVWRTQSANKRSTSY